MRSLCASMLMLALLGVAALPCAAQEKQAQAPVEEAEAPVVAADSMQHTMDMMMPMMGQMMSAMMSGMLDFLAQPEAAEKLATFNRNYFDALMARGFSREESLRIVMAVGMPMMPGQN